MPKDPDWKKILMTTRRPKDEEDEVEEEETEKEKGKVNKPAQITGSY